MRYEVVREKNENEFKTIPDVELDLSIHCTWSDTMALTLYLMSLMKGKISNLISKTAFFSVRLCCLLNRVKVDDVSEQ